MLNFSLTCHNIQVNTCNIFAGCMGLLASDGFYLAGGGFMAGG